MTEPTTDMGPPRPRRWHIFAPTIAIVLLIAVYAVYWISVSREIRTALERFEANPERGLVVGWHELSLGGFPYRIEARFAAPEAGAPETPEAWTWKGEAAEIALLPHNLRHVIVNLRGAQELRYLDLSMARPAENILRASMKGAWGSYVDVTDAPFGRLAIDIEDVEADHQRGADGARDRIDAGRLQLHMRPAPEEVADYDVAFQADTIVIDLDQKVLTLGPEIRKIVVQARARNLPNIERISAVEQFERWRVAGGALAISDLIVQWGPLDMTARGEVTLDDANRPQGRFDTEIADFEGLLDALVRDGLVQEREARIALAGLLLISQFQGGEPGRVRVPVSMNDGRLYLGPLAIARLSPLY
ncbi:MAG: DUF2125 domain-containing protein [Parvibaculum sp.]|uniref:DUF2125 domain-containing protein n=1 Tax=Parvibaculum sp. TaxID=2024848 RepID=UPI00271B2FCE|nr:DUF2125 domain-containing protein [Parvibaculum sp.]MDO8837870.1 DUF2125 domain-containing protein [Parvibaculum sp.]